jgi:hydroxyethylthiazole kinase
MIEYAKIAQAINNVRKETPLVGSWTNFVTIEFVANVQLAVGGRAAMCFLESEAIPLASVAKATYINLGTLTPFSQASLVFATKATVERNKPWVLDPVAAGLGEVRSDILREIKPFKPNIIRGNASEIITLANIWELHQLARGKVDGVDATESVDEAANSALLLAEYTNGAVVTTGEVDLIVSKGEKYNVSGGSAMLKSITGSGCSLGGMLTVFVAVTDMLTASITCSLIYKWASEKAQNECGGTASFKTAFIDNLSQAGAEEIIEYAQSHLEVVE